MRSTVGQVAADTSFFDRVEELRALRQSALRQHILLLAPRRVGKTSLLHRLKGELDCEEGFGGLYADVQGASSELDFLRKVYEAAIQHAKAREVLAKPSTLKKLLGRVREFQLAGFGVRLDETNPEQWQEPARELSEALLQLPGHWYALVDELPVFVSRLLRDSPTRARVFLEWFRSVRQKRPDRDVSLHWILAGSIGLDTIAHRFGLTDTINDLKPFRLGAFSLDTARAFLNALASGEGVALSDSVIERLLDRTSWPIPYHLQALFDQVGKQRGEGKSVVVVDDVDRAFEALLRERIFFDSWYERLADELGEPSATHARALLSACAASTQGATRETLEAMLSKHVADPAHLDRDLRFLLDVLLNDGYLRDDGPRFAFRSNLLREFWRRRYL